MKSDLALETLWFALERDERLMPLSDSAKVLFVRGVWSAGIVTPLGAVPGAGRFGPDKLDVLQTSRVQANSFLRAGYQVITTVQSQYPFVIVLGTRQKDENLFLFAQAAKALAVGGTLLVAMANEHGAGRFEEKLLELFRTVESYIKNRCRIFWAKKTENINLNLLEEWSALGRLRTIEGTRFKAYPGVFGWNKVDRGSQVLVSVLPQKFEGSGADFGAGYGFLSCALAERAEVGTKLHLIEEDSLGLAAARENLELFKSKLDLHYHWLDLTAEKLPGPFDWIVMNPPFHDRRGQVCPIGSKFIQVAAISLKPGGKLYMVANKDLAYEEVLKSGFSKVTKTLEADGFKTFMAIK